MGRMQHQALCRALVAPDGEVGGRRPPALPDDMWRQVAATASLDALAVLQRTSKRTRECTDAEWSAVGPYLRHIAYPESARIMGLARLELFHMGEHRLSEEPPAMTPSVLLGRPGFVIEQGKHIIITESKHIGTLADAFANGYEPLLKELDVMDEDRREITSSHTGRLASAMQNGACHWLTDLTLWYVIPGATGALAPALRCLPKLETLNLLGRTDGADLAAVAAALSGLRGQSAQVGTGLRVLSLSLPHMDTDAVRHLVSILTSCSKLVGLHLENAVFDDWAAVSQALGRCIHLSRLELSPFRPGRAGRNPAGPLPPSLTTLTLDLGAVAAVAQPCAAVAQLCGTTLPSLRHLTLERVDRPCLDTLARHARNLPKLCRLDVYIRGPGLPEQVSDGLFAVCVALPHLKHLHVGSYEHNFGDVVPELDEVNGSHLSNLIHRLKSTTTHAVRVCPTSRY